ncbi:MAG: flagellar basal body P-ring protein FlgI [Polyangiaceae bacterium]|nr:flagellar basal body P-ring protein FlgI [Polyangiaceae bacterium]
MNAALKALRRLHPALIVLGIVLGSRPARAEKLRDLCEVAGARDNQLVGYGVATGLNGTGDDVSAPFASQSLRALLRRLGVQVDSRQLRLRNVAAVVVTATIPPFSRNGTRLDVVVSSIGNARSLRGGVLVQTPLRGADRKTYAVAQGPLVVGGFNASGGSGSSTQENTTTTARVPAGALVEREIATTFVQKDRVMLSLRAPEFATASRIAEAIDKALGKGIAHALDAGAVRVTVPQKLRSSPVTLVARLGDIEVEPVSRARVVINERTGTIVMGGDVRLAPVAVAQGGISITVKETPEVSQPNNLFGGGDTKVVPRTEIESSERIPSAMAFVDGAASLAQVAQALSTFGVAPRELASILQALRAAGALRAEVIVQ